MSPINQRPYLKLSPFLYFKDPESSLEGVQALIELCN